MDCENAGKEQGAGRIERSAPPSSLKNAEPQGIGVGSFCDALARKIAELGLDDFSVVPVGDSNSPAYDLFLDRLHKGYCDGLDYITDRPEARKSPRSALESVRTMIIVAFSEKRLREESREATDALFNAPELALEPGKERARTGTVTGYAACLDYHDALRKRLKELAKFVKAYFPDAETRTAVDTAPILEKSWAIAAGLGWCGMNSLVVHPVLGTRFFLGELLVSTSFEEIAGCADLDAFLARRRAERGEDYARILRSGSDACERCRLCVRACPTGALHGDRSLDARRCLNYWTIENRDEIPEDIALALGGRLFGCDLCQRVCPRNAKAGAADPRELPLDAVERLDEETFRRLFKKTPVFRARVDGLQRTARAVREHGENGSDSE